jgi:membrane associated rhomboid family serine protease
MFARLTPTVFVLLIANVAIYSAQLLLPQLPFEWFALWPLHSGELTGGLPFEPWQLVTYAFLHGSPTHLFFNMFALYMFGPDVEDLLGSARFRVFYLACVVGAALTQLLVSATVYPSTAPTLGASGGIFGLLLCYGMAFPHRQAAADLFRRFPMPAWLFVTLYGVHGALSWAYLPDRPGRGAFRAPGRHGRGIPADSLLALAPRAQAPLGPS